MLWAWMNYYRWVVTPKTDTQKKNVLVFSRGRCCHVNVTPPSIMMQDKFSWFPVAITTNSQEVEKHLPPCFCFPPCLYCGPALRMLNLLKFDANLKSNPDIQLKIQTGEVWKPSIDRCKFDIQSPVLHPPSSERLGFCGSVCTCVRVCETAAVESRCQVLKYKHHTYQSVERNVKKISRDHTHDTPCHYHTLIHLFAFSHRADRQRRASFRLKALFISRYMCNQHVRSLKEISSFEEEEQPV